MAHKNIKAVTQVISLFKTKNPDVKIELDMANPDRVRKVFYNGKVFNTNNWWIHKGETVADNDLMAFLLDNNSTLSASQAKVEPSYNGKNSKNQERTYCKYSSREEKLRLEDDMQTISKEIAMRGGRVTLNELIHVMVDRFGIDLNNDYSFPQSTSAIVVNGHYITPCLIEHALKRFCNDFENLFTTYKNKYQVDYKKYSMIQACMVDAITHKRTHELELDLKIGY